MLERSRRVLVGSLTGSHGGSRARTGYARAGRSPGRAGLRHAAKRRARRRARARDGRGARPNGERSRGHSGGRCTEAEPGAARCAGCGSTRRFRCAPTCTCRCTPHSHAPSTRAGPLRLPRATARCLSPLSQLISQRSLNGPPRCSGQTGPSSDHRRRVGAGHARARDVSKGCPEWQSRRRLAPPSPDTRLEARLLAGRSG